MKRQPFPKGWDKARVQRVLEHYEKQTEAEQVAEDEKAFEDHARTTVQVPVELLPLIREIIAQYKPTGS